MDMLLLLLNVSAELLMLCLMQLLNLYFYLSVELLQISTILVMFEFILRILFFY